ncbi:MAG: efflux transporter outer membrane subunit [Methylovulum sp.]|uniref:efflux transporter outer membrane subunit n=1 Tax=Methylovulum sp. TaxID=1916980 RepID=UPI00263043F2|nr:efflux transporter outer membrane subunit [Methylovulum sp.]MDD2724332.1 efflux transporter outer membrane subunit [Methylovulum sp.]MDD5124928.1 efflux transporter outer membrane subunit [Methylovulum sp.]
MLSKRRDYPLRKPINGLLLAASLMTASCTMGPDFTRPAAPEVKSYTPNAEAEHTVKALQPGKDLPGQWWTLFHSKALTALIEQAIKHNPDLQSAHATLVQARENALSKQGSLWPSLDATGYATRQQISGAQFGNPNFPGSVYSLFNTSIGVSYTLDVFGAIRREIEGLEAQAQYQRFQLEAAFLTIASNIVTTAVQEASVRAQIDATQEMIAAQTQQLDVIKQQFELGSTSKTAILAQQSALEQTKTTLPPLQQQLTQLRNRLKILVGTFPSTDLAAQFTLEEITLPTNLPLSLPSKLVEQRPDIRAQEAMLHAASAQIGVVIASVFPDFTLKANVSTIATEAGNLFAPGSDIWNMTANLAQPIFHGGQLTHQRKVAKAAYQQAASQYRSTVLQAFQHVADTLNALHYDADELQTQASSQNAARETLELTQTQFQIGAVSYLDLLTAQHDYQQAHLGHIKAKATQLGDTAALFLALGGGWWQRADLSQTITDNQPKEKPVRSWLEEFERFRKGK